MSHETFFLKKTSRKKKGKGLFELSQAQDLTHACKNWTFEQHLRIFFSVPTFADRVQSCEKVEDSKQQFTLLTSILNTWPLSFNNQVEPSFRPQTSVERQCIDVLAFDVHDEDKTDQCHPYSAGILQTPAANMQTRPRRTSERFFE